MVRALVIGLLAVWVASCKSDAESPAVAPGAVAGKVVEVSGKVTATRGGATRALDQGAVVFGDDEIETAADGSVVIDLAHNNARWSVESGKKARVDTSLAWKLAKQDATKPVEHDTTPAGREGERTAAETSATAAASAAPAPAAESEAAASPAPARRFDSKAEANKDMAPPAPPPPKPTGSSSKSGAPGGGAGRGGGADRLEGATLGVEAPKKMKQAPSDPDLKPMPAVGADLRAVLETRRGALEKCVAGAKLTVIVRVAKGAATFELTGGSASDKVRTCVAGVIKKLEFPADGEASIELLR